MERGAGADEVKDHSVGIFLHLGWNVAINL